MHPIRKKCLSAQISSVLVLLAIGALASCKPQGDSAPPPSAALEDRGCGESGAMEAGLFGSIEANVRWDASEMDCESMQRPNDEGVRLRFAGDVAGERLAIIIALPELKPDEIGVEIPSNVTATVEGSGRFFSTPNLDACWTEVLSQTRLAGKENIRAIEGTLFCVTPLGEINGDAAVSIPQLTFSTTVNWNKQ